MLKWRRDLRKILVNESGIFYKINIIFCAELSVMNCRTELSNAELSAPKCLCRIVRTPHKSLHWLKIPEQIHLKVMSLTYRSTTFNTPCPLTFANFSPSNLPALPDYPPVLSFLELWSLFISRSPPEPYPSLKNVF